MGQCRRQCETEEEATRLAETMLASAVNNELLRPPNAATASSTMVPPMANSGVEDVNMDQSASGAGVVAVGGASSAPADAVQQPTLIATASDGTTTDASGCPPAPPGLGLVSGLTGLATGPTVPNAGLMT